MAEGNVVVTAMSDVMTLSWRESGRLPESAKAKSSPGRSTDFGGGTGIVCDGGTEQPGP
jgi:hypothetical protein